MKRCLYIAGALLLLYVGAYLSLVEPVRPIGIDASFGIEAACDAVPSYRLGGEFAWEFFRFAQELDTRVRPDYWHFTEEEMNKGRRDGQDW